MLGYDRFIYSCYNLSLVISILYFTCKFNQNLSDNPKYLDNRKAISALMECLPSII